MKKRNIKKEIRRTCGEIACEALFAESLINAIDKNAMQQVIITAAHLQDSALRKTSVAFDKTPRDFASRKEYNKARRAYYKKVFAAINSEFADTLGQVAKAMNGAMPHK
ncbi:MAG: hypothetical protein K2O00_00825 [Muribaculaceae bacterium]|nr:hypothetical protein [Muribaculaceae bacterium]